MRPWWCVLLIAGSAAGDEAAINPKVALPVAPKASKPASVSVHLPMVVTLTKEGRIIVSGANFFFGDRTAIKTFKVRPGLAHVNLDQLSRLFGLAVEWYELVRRAAGGSAFKHPNKDTRVFLRKLHIRADKDAPWAFVQWAAMVAAEQKVTHLELALEAKRTLDLPLPPFKGAWGDIVMHLEGWDDMKPQPHLVVEVHRAKRTVYCVGDEETRSPEQLEAILRKRLTKKKPTPKVVVRADLNATFQGVVTAFDRIYAAGAKEMWWLGEHIPHPDFRKLDRLPRPPR